MSPGGPGAAYLLPAPEVLHYFISSPYKLFICEIMMLISSGKECLLWEMLLERLKSPMAAKMLKINFNSVCVHMHVYVCVCV